MDRAAAFETDRWAPEHIAAFMESDALSETALGAVCEKLCARPGGCDEFVCVAVILEGARKRSMPIARVRDLADNAAVWLGAPWSSVNVYTAQAQRDAVVAAPGARRSRAAPAETTPRARRRRA